MTDNLRTLTNDALDSLFLTGTNDQAEDVLRERNRRIDRHLRCVNTLRDVIEQSAAIGFDVSVDYSPEHEDVAVTVAYLGRRETRRWTGNAGWILSWLCDQDMIGFVTVSLTPAQANLVQEEIARMHDSGLPVVALATGNSIFGPTYSLGFIADGIESTRTAQDLEEAASQSLADMHPDYTDAQHEAAVRFSVKQGMKAVRGVVARLREAAS